ncbi:MAG: aminotransferase class V-fold PLP-dependent enzyme [Alphaproteobacteria bacterium]|nr:aminotransferase class V-fold PLP-dependent enzyme [Alphaproteobacteria bacterium]MBU0794134.1 aminotransferase class V-fold PLP-dependent enzyme [Alphaproteobacteria bacterium]MBU0876723.1 aminotransferase class V-fold PLP-dependent enzyme [Alphaproteobacteria bacterium]MBU1769425.1 aminotransferase class V-fold PLP-dependent enzyme [Alphaproteobacteria bacterium]
MEINRRQMVMALAAAPVAGRVNAAPAPVPATGAQPDDEAYWAGIAAHYDVTDEVIPLENGNWGMMARPVLERYQAAVRHVNRENSYYARRGMGADLMAVRDRLAARMGFAPQEIAFTRNATEALKTLIGGYNRLRPGDAVLYADLDYDSMQACFDSLRSRRGVEVVRIALPEPATYQGLIDAYEAALRANPRIRLILLTHLSHRTGLVVPVREIIAMARARGVDAIVDAAHSWGQIDTRPVDLDADFIGFNLHKWWGAPLGVGLVYIRQSKVDLIDPDSANSPPFAAGAYDRVHTGTLDFAAQLTVPDALDFQDRIGDAARAGRLRRLRDLWAEPLRGEPGLEILTPTDRRLYGGITSFRFAGRTSVADNKAIAQRLLAEHRIFTVHRDGPAGGACVRITPALFNSALDVETLRAGLVTVLRAQRG